MKKTRGQKSRATVPLTKFLKKCLLCPGNAISTYVLHLEAFDMTALFTHLPPVKRNLQGIETG
jgi:hypothetical protein